MGRGEKVGGGGSDRPIMVSWWILLRSIEMCVCGFF